jgi:hypothetical protein
LATLLTVGGFFTACDLINPEEPIPAYLYITPFTFNTVPSIEGSNNAKITEGWVFVNGEFLGAYSLPALVPVIAQGQADIRIEAGIKENGISTTPEINPFFEPFRIQRPLAPNEVDTIRPGTRYIPETKIGFIEDFEDNRPRIFTQSLIGGRIVERTATEVFEGDYSGVITLDASQPLLEIASAPEFTDLLSGGVYVYLEMNYKSEAPVAWGLAANVDPAVGLESFLDPGFFPSEEWNKIYFSLSPIIFGAQLDDENYRVALQAFLGAGSPDTARVYLDNIKLLHF